MAKTFIAENDAKHDGVFTCYIYNRTFRTSKGLKQHQRSCLKNADISQPITTKEVPPDDTCHNPISSKDGIPTYKWGAYNDTIFEKT